MTSTAFNPAPNWHWPAETGTSPASSNDRSSSPMPGSFHETFSSDQGVRQRTKPDQTEGTKQQANPDPSATPRPRKHWAPRTCRICLETVDPTFRPPLQDVPGLFQAAPSVNYDSPDPEAGRLLRPCKCKGSSKYVHEGCLQAWRHADPGYGKRNYWQCPTCGFRYRLERMQWSRRISSTAAQIILTVLIFLVALFVMGFVADPIINLYSDPFSIISSAPLSKVGSKLEPIFSDDDVPTWTEHFIKGLASLGLLGFVKVFLALSPWQWWQIRSSGVMRGGGQSGTTGRDRVASISWIVVIVGVVTFLWAVYKGVRAWSRRTLEKAGERVMDVAGDERDEVDDDE